jgi:hypothetical protein
VRSHACSELLHDRRGATLLSNAWLHHAVHTPASNYEQARLRAASVLAAGMSSWISAACIVILVIHHFSTRCN